jgi:hypothetical protein
MMIDAEIYGMIPSAKIVKRDSAPPENMLNMPRMPPCCELNRSARTLGSIPGPECAHRSIHDQRAQQEPQPALQIAELAALANGIGICCQRSNLSLTRDRAASGFDRSLGTLGRTNALERHLAADSHRTGYLGGQRITRNDTGLPARASRSISSTGRRSRSDRRTS